MLVSSLQARDSKRIAWLALGGGLIGGGAFILDLALVVLLSVITGTAWHLFSYGETGDIAAFMGVGALAGLFYTLPFVFRSEYRIEVFLASARPLARVLSTWTYAFFCLGALAFFTQTTGLASRGWLGLFYLLGAAGVLAGNLALTSMVRTLVAGGLVAPRRILLVGRRAEVDAFRARDAKRSTGIAVAATAILPEALPGRLIYSESLDDIIDSAIERARSLGVGEVVVMAGSEDTMGLVSRIANRFLDLPVAVHLGRLPAAEQFPNLAVARLGNTRTLTLRPAPLNGCQLTMKRALDLVVAGLALLVLAPLIAFIALLVRLDSPGPVFFRQRRRGFNQKEFTIWKFRTMTTLDDGHHIEQARANDPRITRLGAILRRFNIDELPQLLNVIRGEMSLVGPRPHAVAHDEHYGRIIRRYRRRLNVKPGITGWAQVNGYRGRTETEHAMRSRIAHDLYYIDNWSLALDLYIIALTVLSPKAFRNAV